MSRKYFKSIINAISIVLITTEKVIAFGESVTGIPEVDKPGWILTSAAQAVIFWICVLFSLKSLLEFAIKRDKKSITEFFIGFFIIACDYLVPWGFIAIKKLCTGN